MESETLYKIVVIVILLIFLIYNIMKTPASNSSNNSNNSNNSDKPGPDPPANNVQANSLISATPILTTTYLQTTDNTPSTITLVVYSPSTLTNTISILASLSQGLEIQTPAFTGIFSNTPNNTLNIASIQYLQNFLYFYGYDPNSSYPPAMILAISSYYVNCTVNDTSSNSSTYSTTTASASGNTLTLTSGSDTLTIGFQAQFQ